MPENTPDLAPRKPPGWFSRRHQTSAQHRAAGEAYKARHGRAARRQRAEERSLVANLERLAHEKAVSDV